jgi:predicted hotdog family 3-hydroxylacyl-ACP dehydratase
MGDAVSLLVPQRGAMCFLDRVIDAGEDGVICQGVLRRDNPLLREDLLPSWALLEFLAQAAAVHHGLSSRASSAKGDPTPGFLVSVQDAEFASTPLLVGEEVRVRLKHETSHGDFSIFVGEAHRAGERLCRARLITVRSAPSDSPADAFTPA